MYISVNNGKPKTHSLDLRRLHTFFGQNVQKKIQICVIELTSDFRFNYQGLH